MKTSNTTPTEEYSLIAEIQKRPIIWDESLTKHRYELQQQWAEIAEILNQPHKVLQSRWKYLKNKFKQELQSQVQNGSQSNWHLFRRMEFIKAPLRNIIENNNNNNSGEYISPLKHKYWLTLLEEIRIRPVIWDPSIPATPSMISESWKELSKTISKTYLKCRKDWSRLKVKYRDYLQLEIEMKKVPQEIDPALLEVFKKMAFIRPHYKLVHHSESSEDESVIESFDSVDSDKSSEDESATENSDTAESENNNSNPLEYIIYYIVDADEEDEDEEQTDESDASERSINETKDEGTPNILSEDGASPMKRIKLSENNNSNNNSNYNFPKMITENEENQRNSTNFIKNIIFKENF